MSWATGIIVVLVIAIGVPWAVIEITETLAMRRRLRNREAYRRYIEEIERELWKGPTN